MPQHVVSCGGAPCTNSMSHGVTNSLNCWQKSLIDLNVTEGLSSDLSFEEASSFQMVSTGSFPDEHGE